MASMFQSMSSIFKIPELKRRVLFTLGILVVYRVGGHVPTAGINGSALAGYFSQQQGSLLGLYDMFVGGAFANATIFALGIMPYISASIILQLLQAVVPYFEKLAKEGEEGRKKINQLTRYGTVGLALVQSFGMSFAVEGLGVVAYPGLGFKLMFILTLTTGLTAGKMGVPFMPAFTALGSDLHQTNPNLTTTACPFTRQRLTAVRAIHPDVTVVQVQRADEEGGFHFWGNLGVTREACLAAKTVLVCAEEIVPSAVIRSDPNRSLIPSFRVRTVCHVPWGGHPSPVPGYYNRDHRAFLEYRDESRSEADYLHWKQHWIDSVPTRDAYLQRLGSKRMAALALKEHVYSEPVDYGY